MEKREMAEVLHKVKMMLPTWAPKEINEELAALWCAVLKDYPDAEIKKAFFTAMNTLTEWPAPATIKRLCMGSGLSDEEIGQDVAARIEESISRFGYTGHDRAQAFIGEIGWEVVRQSGGWRHICDVTTNDMLPSSRKQWRELATVVSKKFHTTGGNVGPALPRGANTGNPALAAAMSVALAPRGVSVAGTKQCRCPQCADGRPHNCIPEDCPTYVLEPIAPTPYADECTPEKHPQCHAKGEYLFPCSVQEKHDREKKWANYKDDKPWE